MFYAQDINCNKFVRHFHKYRKGSTGPTGMNGQTGPTGITGPTGTIMFVSNVNNSVFVDTTFGNDSTGQRENPNLPFKTIQSALTASIAQDVIIVRPGIYTEGNIRLKSQVNFYFELGASLLYTGPEYAFLDDGVAVVSVIDGFGDFNVTNGLLSITGRSEIMMNGHNFQSLGGSVPFISQTAISTFTMQGNQFFIFNPVSVLRLKSPSCVTKFTANNVVCPTVFLLFEPNCDGKVNIDIKNLQGGSSTRGLFEILSSFGIILVNISLVSSNHREAYFLNVNATLNRESQLDFQITQLIINGGLINSTSPVDLSLKNIIINAKRIKCVTLENINPIQITNTLLFLTFETAKFSSTLNISVINAITSDVTINGDRLEIVNIGFSVLNGGIFKCNLILALMNSYVVLNDAMTNVTFSCQDLRIVTNVNQMLFQFSGLTNLNIMHMDVLSTTNSNSNIPAMFNILSLEKVLIDIALLTYNMDFIDVFRTIVDSITYLQLKVVNNMINSNTTLINNSGKIECQCDELQMNAGGVAYIGFSNSTGICNFKNIIYQSPGNLFETKDNCLLTINCESVTITHVLSTTGSLMFRPQDTSSIIANITKIDFNGSSENFTGSIIYSTETSLIQLQSDVINASNCDIVFFGANGIFDINIQRLNCEVGIAKVFYLPNVNATLKINTARIILSRQDIGSSFIHTALNATLNLSGEYFTVLATDVNLNGCGILVENDSRLYGNVSYFDCDGQILSINTTTSAFYNTVRSTSNYKEAVLCSPLVNAGQYTFGGYFSCGPAAPAVIYYNFNDAAFMRLFGSTLVSLGSMPSILSTSNLTVSMQPSSATKAVSGPITLVPATAFFVDNGVF